MPGPNLFDRNGFVKNLLRFVEINNPTTPRASVGTDQPLSCGHSEWPRIPLSSILKGEEVGAHSLE
jgi:hypothetical protein